MWIHAGWDDELLDRLAREVRDAGAGAEDRPCRLEEVMEFARRAGVHHLGVVFCSGFREEARHLKAVLGSNGFLVSSVCCKTGAVPKERMGITDAEKVRPGQTEMICNPLAQAELLEDDEVELVLLMGQCVGHDSATMARLKTPAVCLVAKDRVLAHNTVAALYEPETGGRPGRDTAGSALDEVDQWGPWSPVHGDRGARAGGWHGARPLVRVLCACARNVTRSGSRDPCSQAMFAGCLFRPFRPPSPEDSGRLIRSMPATAVGAERRWGDQASVF